MYRESRKTAECSGYINERRWEGREGKQRERARTEFHRYVIGWLLMSETIKEGRRKVDGRQTEGRQNVQGWQKDGRMQWIYKPEAVGS